MSAIPPAVVASEVRAASPARPVHETPRSPTPRSVDCRVVSRVVARVVRPSEVCWATVIPG
ncbi:hypothetical protein AD006_06245 [Pseudonocardia sp. EC080610-09]|nr:hypothetical protein FRP1_27065 [Pseudonocardia sp. EC080625-04]ALL75008.1 hypothetical protein AD006_06245 [Pseudonocardia sp. EC080610-09]